MIFFDRQKIKKSFFDTILISIFLRILSPEMLRFGQVYHTEILELDVFERADFDDGAYSIEDLFKSMRFSTFLEMDQKWRDELPN